MSMEEIRGHHTHFVCEGVRADTPKLTGRHGSLPLRETVRESPGTVPKLACVWNRPLDDRLPVYPRFGSFAPDEISAVSS